MKYLKKFNESTSNLYKEITSDEYLDLYLNNLVTISKSNLILIRKSIPSTWDINTLDEVDHKVLNKERYDIIGDIEFIDIQTNIHLYAIKPPYIGIKNGRTLSITIKQLSDDWFIIYSSTITGSIKYKCDEIDGVMQYLNSLK